MIQHFPNVEIIPDKENDNPAIRLYGRRFYKDQTEIELLTEFLLVFVSPKTVGFREKMWQEAFPDAQAIQELAVSGGESGLAYHPKPRLILKLFSFLGSSKVETRHRCHAEKFRGVTEQLKRQIDPSSKIGTDEALKLLEQVMVGFVGVAQNRTWCTHSFLPVSANLIASETIWSPTEALKEKISSWDQAVSKGIFKYSAHDFMARGGELLFLQLLNLFRCLETDEVRDFKMLIGHSEQSGETFLADLQNGIREFLCRMPYLSDLADWIESADFEAASSGKDLKTKCGWVPASTWPESYLFAYELVNILRATIDPLEKLELLKLCAVFQVLRTLSAQAARVCDTDLSSCSHLSGPLGFVWLITAPENSERPLKQASQKNFAKIQEIIFKAVRKNDELYEAPKKIRKKDRFKDGDEQSMDLFSKLGKKIGLIVPWKGPGARFTVNEILLRYLTLSIVAPGQRMTLTSFQKNLFNHYGISIGGEQLRKGVKWTLADQDISVPYAEQQWFEDALKASGFLIQLSDAVSLVHNPFKND
jgi:hypothetical protein